MATVQDLSTSFIATPPGCLEAVHCRAGLHGLRWCNTYPASDTVQLVESKDEDASNATLLFLLNYFDNRRSGSLNLCGLDQVCELIECNYTHFQKDVWKAARDSVYFGETATYSQIANQINRPRSARAVGNALRTNPFCIVIPCHRVIRSGGALGHYAGGRRDDVKVWLIQHENGERKNKK